MRKTILLAALAGACVLPAFGSGFVGLCNTGVAGPCSGSTGTGSGLASPGNELNWAGTGFQALVPASPLWSNLGSNASQWISSTSSTFAAPGVYAYTIQFMTGPYANLSSGFINGRYASDNNALSVSLNGTNIPGFPLTLNDSSAFSQWTNFSITNGFNLGMNTLVFTISNEGAAFNPGGFRAEFLNSGVADAVPEPSAFLLGGMGLVAVGLVHRRSKSKR
jgi:hypothetical protein